MRTIPVHHQGCSGVIISWTTLARICIGRNFKCGEQPNELILPELRAKDEMLPENAVWVGDEELARAAGTLDAGRLPVSYHFRKKFSGNAQYLGVDGGG